MTVRIKERKKRKGNISYNSPWVTFVAGQFHCVCHSLIHAQLESLLLTWATEEPPNLHSGPLHILPYSRSLIFTFLSLICFSADKKRRRSFSLLRWGNSWVGKMHQVIHLSATLTPSCLSHQVTKVNITLHPSLETFSLPVKKCTLSPCVPCLQ